MARKKTIPQAMAADHEPEFSPKKRNHEMKKNTKRPRSPKVTGRHPGQPAKDPVAKEQDKPSQRQAARKKMPREIVVTKLAVDSLRPNDWNPNTMSEEDYRTFRDEVESQGKLPKPIVVIPDDRGYLIVDGEHGWRVARDLGFAEVPCEVLETDRFEAMRQTVVRNRHGEMNPLLLGRLYDRMIAENNLSNRRLAAALSLTEGTIRNYRAYARAAKLRKHYAPADADELIGKLTVQQVQSYLERSDDERDAWLNGGAEPENVARPNKQLPSLATTLVHGSSKNDEDHLSETSDPPRAENVREPGATNDESVNRQTLGELKRIWRHANEATRRRFLHDVAADQNTTGTKP